MQTPWYNRYNTPLNDDERRGLYQFLMDLSMQEGRNAFNDLNNYDMAGAYKVGQNEQGGNGHFTDTFKKPNHPTFSDESQYHGTYGYYGGHWSEDNGVWSFSPSSWNLENLPAEEMKRYFAENDPEARLVLPEEGADSMAVHYINNNRGGLGNGLGIVGTLLSFVPGMQGVGAGMGAIGSALNGNYTGAAKNVLGAAGVGNTEQGTVNPTANTLNAPLGSGMTPEDIQRMYRNYNLGR